MVIPAHLKGRDFLTVSRAGIGLGNMAALDRVAAHWRRLNYGTQPRPQKPVGTYDLVFAFDAVHDQKDPQEMLATIRRSLRDDGTFLMVDIGGSSRLENNLEHPLGAYLYMMSTMHCTPVSLGQGGDALGTMWGIELAMQMLEAAGFGNINVSRLPHDAFNAYFVATA